MSKQYRWCENSGAVAYPDDSHRMLDSYDVLVSGPGWAELAELGFVEEVGDAPAAKAEKKPAPAANPEPLPVVDAEPEAEEKPAAGSNKTVSEMAREAAADSDEEPSTVMGKAKKVLSKRKK